MQCYSICVNAMRQTKYVRVHIPLHSCCMLLCARKKKTRSKFDLLSEVIFNDLAVTAIAVKLMYWMLVCPSCGQCFTDTSYWDISGGKLCSGPQSFMTIHHSCIFIASQFC